MPVFQPVTDSQDSDHIFCSLHQGTGSDKLN